MKKLKSTIIVFILLNISSNSAINTNLIKWTCLSLQPIIYGYLAFKPNKLRNNSAKKIDIQKQANIELKKIDNPYTTEKKIKKRSLIKKLIDMIDNSPMSYISLIKFANKIYDNSWKYFDDTINELSTNSRLIFTFLTAAATIHLFEKAYNNDPGSFALITLTPLVLAPIIYYFSNEITKLIDDFD